MHNSKIIQSFIDKVNSEAEEAANAVFKKYDDEWKALVENQLKKGEYLYCVNGSAYIEGVDPYYYSDACDAFISTVASIQYLEQRASFNVYEFKKE